MIHSTLGKAMLLSTVILTTSNESFASSSKKPFTGPYAFARVGGTMSAGQHDTISPTGQGEAKLKAFGAQFGGGAGYLMMTDGKAVMGGEAYYDMFSGKANQNLTTPQLQGKVSIQHKSAFGGGFIIGAAANPKLVMYAKASMEFNKIDLNYTDLTNQANPNQKTSKSTKGIVPGAGALYRLSNSFLVGGEYTYAILTKKQIADTGYPQRSFVYKPAEHRANVRVMWMF